MPRQRLSQQELFVKYHGRQIVSLGVLVWLVVMAQAIWQKANFFSAYSGQVMGAAVVQTMSHPGKPLDNAQHRLLKYQARLKLILQDYLQQRSRFERPHQDWIFLINNVRHKIMQLDVPAAYRELHLSAVMILDAEKTAVQNSDLDAIDQNSQQWEELLEKFFWLNN